VRLHECPLPRRWNTGENGRKARWQKEFHCCDHVRFKEITTEVATYGLLPPKVSKQALQVVSHRLRLLATCSGGASRRSPIKPRRN